MMMRDLKADLGIARGMKPLNTSEYYEGISLETAQQYMMAAEGWPHAIERALKAESLVRELAYGLEEATRILASYQWVRERLDVEMLAAIGIWSDLVAKAKEVLGNDR